MGRRLQRFFSGKPLLRQLTSKALNGIIAAIEENKPIAGKGLVARQTSGGIALDVIVKPGKSGGGAAIEYPFDMTIVDAGGGLSTVRLRSGTIGGLTPTNMFAGFSVSQTGTWYILVTVTVVGNVISTCELSVSSTPADSIGCGENAPPTSYDITLGVIVDNVGLNIIRSSPNPVSTFRYRAHRAIPVAPGESAWNYFYTWSW